MRHPYICLGGLVGVAVAVGPWSVSWAGRPVRSVAAASIAVPNDRPALHTLRLAEPQVMARFIPEVRTRRDLRERALMLWRTRFAPQAEVIRQRFVQEDDWRAGVRRCRQPDR